MKGASRANMEGALQKAEECFGCCRYVECEQQLQEVLEGASLAGQVCLQCQVKSNLLACRMKAALQQQSVQELRAIHTGYCGIWEILQGLPCGARSIVTEVCVACNLSQLQFVLQSSGVGVACALPHLHLTALSRVTECVRLEGGIQPELKALSHLLHEQLLHFLAPNCTAVVYNCLCKLFFFEAMLCAMDSGGGSEARELLEQLAEATRSQGLGDSSEEALFALAVRVKKRLEEELHPHAAPTALMEMTYASAWECYQLGDFAHALGLLRPLCANSAPPLLRGCACQLSGCCFARLGKCQLALHCFLKCLVQPPSPPSSSTALLLALQGCAEAYYQLGNSQAALSLLRLLLRGLRVQRGGASSSPSALVSVLSLHPSPPHLPHILTTTCTLGMRALEIGLYAEAADSFASVLDAVTSGEAVPGTLPLPSTLPLPLPLPLPSTLHLLRAQALISKGSSAEAVQVCRLLSHTLLQPANAFLSGEGGEGEGGRLMLGFLQALHFKAMASFHLKQEDQAIDHWKRCLQLIRRAVPLLATDSSLLSCAQLLQCLVLNDVGVAVANRGDCHNSLRFLSSAVSMATQCPPAIAHLVAMNHSLVLWREEGGRV